MKKREKTFFMAIFRGFLMNKVYILTECGENIGSGHITRMGALNEVLIEEGFSVSMLVDVKGKTEFTFPENTLFLNWKNDAELPDLSGSVLLIDSYLCEENYYSYLKEKATAVVAVDDYGRLLYDADVIINPGVSFYKVDYSDQKASVFGGGNYTILRDSFRKNRKFTVKKELTRFFVSVGAEDPCKIVPFLCRKVFPYIKNAEFHIVTAKDSYKEELKSVFASCENYVFYGFLSESEIVSLISLCDAAFLAAGQTLVEAVALGVPSVAFAIEKDQVPNLTFFAEKSIISDSLFFHSEDFAIKALSLLEAVKSFDERTKRSSLGAEIVDKKGVYRISDIIGGLF